MKAVKHTRYVWRTIKQYAKKMHCKSTIPKNDRGVALIIVLLVTALLIALVFEFAYSTRVSVRAAQNFRDRERAYFLARSAMKYFNANEEWRNSLEQDKWNIVPIISAGDTEVAIKPVDERRKLSINLIDVSPIADCIDNLFINQGVSADAFNRVKERKKEAPFNLITELHAVMKDDDYNKIAPFLTPYYADQNVNLNVAPVQVLMSLGCSEGAAKNIDELRKRETLTISKLTPYCKFLITLTNANLPEKSTLFKVYSSATVGGYTKQIEAISDTSSFLYWKAL